MPGSTKDRLALTEPWNKQCRSQRPTKANLVHDSDARILALLVELEHSRGDVARSDDVLLLSDGGLDDGGVEGIRDQADDKVVLGHLGVEGGIVGHVEGDGRSILDTGRQGLCGFESPASCKRLSVSVCEKTSLEQRRGKEKCVPTVTGMPFSERISKVGLVTKPAPSINTLAEQVSISTLANAGWDCSGWD